MEIITKQSHIIAGEVYRVVTTSEKGLVDHHQCIINKLCNTKALIIIDQIKILICEKGLWSNNSKAYKINILNQTKNR